VSVTIPPGTQHGTKIKIPGKGVMKLAPNQHQRGDHYITINIKIPKNLNKE